MVLTLDNFEDQVHALILARGREYLLREMVQKMEETQDGWMAEVKSESSGSYKVRLYGNKAFEDWDCNCPFDHGPVCKHVAALLYALQQVEDYEKEEIEMTNEHLAKLSLEDRSILLKDAVKTLPELRQFILKRYYKSIPEEKAE